MQITDEITERFMLAMRSELACWSIEKWPSPIIGGQDKIVAHDGKRVIKHLVDSDDPPPLVDKHEFDDSMAASNFVSRAGVRAGLEAVLGGKENEKGN